MISRDDVRKLAALARIKLEESEEQGLAQDMENILAFVTQINEVSGSGKVAEFKTKNVLRDDREAHESGIHTEALIKEAPHSEKKYVKVKKILS